MSAWVLALREDPPNLAKFQQGINKDNVNTIVDLPITNNYPNPESHNPISYLIKNGLAVKNPKPFLDHLLRNEVDVSIIPSHYKTKVGLLARGSSWGIDDGMFKQLQALNNGTYMLDGKPYTALQRKVPGISFTSSLGQALGFVGEKKPEPERDTSSMFGPASFNPLATVFGAGGYRMSQKRKQKSRKSRKSRKSQRKTPRRTA